MLTTLQLYLWSKFPQNKPKLWKFIRNLLGRQVQVQLIDILCSRIMPFRGNFEPQKICPWKNFMSAQLIAFAYIWQILFIQWSCIGQWQKTYTIHNNKSNKFLFPIYQLWCMICWLDNYFRIKTAEILEL